MRWLAWQQWPLQERASFFWWVCVHRKRLHVMEVRLYVGDAAWSVCECCACVCCLLFVVAIVVGVWCVLVIGHVCVSCWHLVVVVRFAVIHVAVGL